MEKLGAGDPRQIGAYRLLARLGAGGMGQVYLARSDRGRTVAVKLVRAELAEQEEFRARFRQEVQAARRVGGHWTAPVLDADTEAVIPWVATGYVAGPSLETVVGHDHGALPERSVRILAAGLANALKDIHAAGLIHRDLKPSNVLVTIDGPRVIDFGIARALETVTDGGLTRTGALVGSPGFMAPEQVRGDRVTAACDVFCLGSVLSYAATGALPFGASGSGAHAMMFRIVQEDPDLTGVPESLADLVRACLRKDPAARPGLDEILARTGAQDTVAGGRTRDPWLPAALVAQLGRHAVRLLDAEDPDERPAPAGPPGPVRPPGPGLPAADPSPSAAPVAPGARPARPSAPPGSAADAPSGASPEHAPAPPEDGTAAPGSGAGPADRPPTLVAGAGTASGPAGPPAAYGGPQQHPQPTGQDPAHPAYGGPRGGWGGPPAAGPFGATPPPGSTTPYAPGPPFPYAPAAGAREPAARSGRSTAFLVVVAVVVALGAGGSVYALMQGGGSGGTDDGKASPAASAGPASPDGGGSPAPSAASGSPSAAAAADGTVPDAFLGTWDARIDNATGHNTRRLTIRQGEAGDRVLTLTADGPAGSGTYHCVFQAPLTRAPAAGGPLEIGPSQVTSGEPRSACSPGAASEITVLPDGRLRRLNTASGESLTYARSG
ncbi:protein kinase [Streptomyces sp. NPDC048566]|uniref:protein kinase domain-containing protein n=1 Tax=Streptomyces sp. NPDC048566 TaxID=3365569 RepID=UPI00371B1424